VAGDAGEPASRTEGIGHNGRVSDPSVGLPPDPSRVPSSGERPRVVIVGGGPGGYEAALTGARLGAEVTLIEERGLGGAAVLTDVVPSKTLIATADVLDLVADSSRLGIRDSSVEGASTSRSLTVDLAAVNDRVRSLAAAQSADIRASLTAAGVRIVPGRGRLDGPQRVVVAPVGGADSAPLSGSTVPPHGDDGASAPQTFDADVILLALGARPRELETAPCDGERILNWTQLYALDELPEHLIVVGSGVTGAEFASAYRALGSEVTLVSSREKVLPGTDPDAADVLEDAFARRGVHLASRSRAASARREGDGVVVTLTSGEEITGSHALMALGGIPATAGLGLVEAGVRVRQSGHVETDRVSRTSVRGIYAAGDCTGVHPLASVAAMQGRIAMHHALGDAVSPLIVNHVSSAVFTSPEIATVGVTEQEVREGRVSGEVKTLRLETNPRAKMQGITEGFVKLVVRAGSHTVIGAVVVAPRASELILPFTLAVAHRLTAEQVAGTSTIYPSLTGSLAEVARRDDGAAHP